jgi:hypothetical protein
MGLNYRNQNPLILIGTKSPAGVTTGVTLESTYQTDEATTAIKTFTSGGFSKLSLDIAYTMGAAETANTIEMVVESSPDRINFYRLPIDATVTQSTITAREWTHLGTNAATSKINIFLDIAYKFMRVSFKETGVASAKGKVFCEATLSGF